MFLILWASPWAWENCNIYPLLVKLPIVKTGLKNNLELYIWRCFWEFLFGLKYINIHSWLFCLHVLLWTSFIDVTVQCFLIPVTFSSNKEARCISQPHSWHGANISLLAALSPSLETRPTGSILYFCFLSQSIKNQYKDVPLFLNPAVRHKPSRSLIKWTQNGFLTAVGSWCSPFPR